MQVQSCNPSGMIVDPKTYNACTFEIIDKWDSKQHAKTCDTMFYLRNGTGAYVWDCDKWIFLDFTGYTIPDWKAKEEEAGFIKNKPFETLGNGLVVDENGVLSVCVENKFNLLPNSTWNLGVGTWTMNPVSDNNFEILDPEDDKPTSHILHGKPISAGTQQTSNLPHPIRVEAGDVITIAFDFKENKIPDRNSTIFSLRVFPERNTGNSQANALWFQNISHSVVNPDWATTPILGFTRFAVTFTPQATGWLDPVVYDSDTSGTHESWFRELMVIKGEACEMPDEWYPFFGDQVQSDWDVTSTADPAYIKNKPSIPDPQIQSDWAQSNTSAVDFIKNKPTIPPAQVQSDWNVTDTNSKAFIKNKPVIPEGAVLYPSTGQNTDGAMTQKATTDELLKRFTDKGALPKPTDMNTLTEAGSYSMSNFIAGTDVINHPPLAVDSGGKCYALILVFRNSDRPVTTQFWFTSSASTPKPTFFFRTQAQNPLVWSEWEALDNQAPDLSGYVTLATDQTITATKNFTARPVLHTVSTANLQGTLDIYLRNNSSVDMQRQTLLWMNPNLDGQTSNGFTFGIGMGANAIFGGGESARSLLLAIENSATTPPALEVVGGGHENGFLVADTNVYIGSGYQSGGATGYWWKFDNTGKLYDPNGSEILSQTANDGLYVSLTEVNHVLGETTFDNVKASSDTDGWVTITDRKNGFTGGTIKYKRHMNVVTIHGDNITCPALAQFSPKVICNIPDGARITDGKPTGSGHVSNVAMGFHAETNGDVYIHNSAALTTAMHANFTFTYVV